MVCPGSVSPCSAVGGVRSLQVSVDDSRVQELLRRMTGMDLDRVFVSRREPLALPRYKLMNEQQLKKVTSP